MSRTPSPAAERMQHGWAMALTALLVTFARAPRILLEGRMWAEEGSDFFQDLYGSGFGEATGYVYKGTLQLLTNWSVWLATRVPLTDAALVTAWSGMAVLLVLAVQWGRWTRAAGIAPVPALLALLAFLLLPANYEVIATATNQQWLCSLSILLVALYPPDLLRRGFGAVAAWTALCGLTGVPSCMLAPAFLARGVIDRSWRHAALSGALAATSLVQLYTLVHFPPEGRAFSLDPWLAAVALATQTVIAPTSVARIGSGVGNLAHAWGMAGSLAVAVVLLVTLAGIALLFRMARSAGAARLSLAILGGAWIGVTLLNQFGALDPPRLLVAPPGGARYFLLGIFCLLILLAWASGSRAWPRLGRAVPAALALMCALGAGQRLALDWASISLAGPSWRSQAARCEAAPARACAIRIWPAQADRPGWWVRLPPRMPPARGLSEL